MIESIFLQADFTVYFFLATIILIFITGIGIYYSNKHTKESNDLTRESNKLLETELRNRMRPLLEFERESNTSGISGDEEKQKVVLNAVLKNSGEVPIRKAWAYYKTTNNDKIIEIIKEKKDIRVTGLELGTIQQGGHYPFHIPIPWTSGQGRTNFVIWFDYQYLKEKDQSVVVFSLVPGGHPIPQRLLGFACIVWSGVPDLNK